MFEVIRRVTSAGVAVVYISHRMRELAAIGSASRCCVMEGDGDLPLPQSRSTR